MMNPHEHGVHTLTDVGHTPTGQSSATSDPATDDHDPPPEASPPARCGTIAQVTSRPAAAQRLREPQASDAEVVQELTEQPYGVRDCAVRDSAGNLIRIQELR